MSDLAREVIGSKGNRYTVQFIDGIWYCNCPAFQYQLRQKGYCKHIQKIQRETTIKVDV